jgi:membrane-bound inhibitor of C-type lysozyme
MPVEQMATSATKDPAMKSALLIISLSVLAGCATTGGNAAERHVTYACNYGPNLVISYGPRTARIESSDGTVTLRQWPSSSGSWYESATHSLRVNGDDITYKDRQMAPRQCHAT